jgi:phospholipase/carboxylesterase
MTYLDCETIETNDNIDSAVIWLHGLGANGYDFIPIIPRLNLPEHLGIRFIFPHAPYRSVTLNGGMAMSSWYDIYSLEKGSKVDHEGIKNSNRAIVQLIDREIAKGIDSRRIILAGFSQGGAVALDTGLTYSKPLGGLMSLSSYFPTRDTIQPLADQNLAIALYHGTDDSVVTEQLADLALKKLQAFGYQPEFHLYPMAHEVHPQEIADISTFIQGILKQ